MKQNKVRAISQLGRRLTAFSLALLLALSLVGTQDWTDAYASDFATTTAEQTQQAEQSPAADAQDSDDSANSGDGLTVPSSETPSSQPDAADTGST